MAGKSQATSGGERVTFRQGTATSTMFSKFRQQGSFSKKSMNPSQFVKRITGTVGMSRVFGKSTRVSKRSGGWAPDDSRATGVAPSQPLIAPRSRGEGGLGLDDDSGIPRVASAEAVDDSEGYIGKRKKLSGIAATSARIAASAETTGNAGVTDHMKFSNTRFKYNLEPCVAEVVLFVRIKFGKHILVLDRENKCISTVVSLRESFQQAAERCIWQRFGISDVKRYFRPSVDTYSNLFPGGRVRDTTAGLSGTGGIGRSNLFTSNNGHKTSANSWLAGYNAVLKSLESQGYRMRRDSTAVFSEDVNYHISNANQDNPGFNINNMQSAASGIYNKDSQSSTNLLPSVTSGLTQNSDDLSFNIDKRSSGGLSRLMSGLDTISANLGVFPSPSDGGNTPLPSNIAAQAQSAKGVGLPSRLQRGSTLATERGIPLSPTELKKMAILLTVLESNINVGGLKLTKVQEHYCITYEIVELTPKLGLPFLFANKVKREVDETEEKQREEAKAEAKKSKEEKDLLGGSKTDVDDLDGTRTDRDTGAKTDGGVINRKEKIQKADGIIKEKKDRDGAQTDNPDQVPPIRRKRVTLPKMDDLNNVAEPKQDGAVAELGARGVNVLPMPRSSLRRDKDEGPDSAPSVGLLKAPKSSEDGLLMSTQSGGLESLSRRQGDDATSDADSKLTASRGLGLDKSDAKSEKGSEPPSKDDKPDDDEAEKEAQTAQPKVQSESPLPFSVVRYLEDPGWYTRLREEEEANSKYSLLINHESLEESMFLLRDSFQLRNAQLLRSFVQVLGREEVREWEKENGEAGLDRETSKESKGSGDGTKSMITASQVVGGGVAPSITVSSKFGGAMYSTTSSKYMGNFSMLLSKPIATRGAGNVPQASINVQQPGQVTWGLASHLGQSLASTQSANLSSVMLSRALQSNKSLSHFYESLAFEPYMKSHAAGAMGAASRAAKSRGVTASQLFTTTMEMGIQSFMGGYQPNLANKSLNHQLGNQAILENYDYFPSKRGSLPSTGLATKNKLFTIEGSDDLGEWNNTYAESDLSKTSSHDPTFSKKPSKESKTGSGSKQGSKPVSKMGSKDPSFSGSGTNLNQVLSVGGVSELASSLKKQGVDSSSLLPKSSSHDGTGSKPQRNSWGAGITDKDSGFDIKKVQRNSWGAGATANQIKDEISYLGGGLSSPEGLSPGGLDSGSEEEQVPENYELSRQEEVDLSAVLATIVHSYFSTTSKSVAAVTARNALSGGAGRLGPNLSTAAASATASALGLGEHSLSAEGFGGLASVFGLGGVNSKANQLLASLLWELEEVGKSKVSDVFTTTVGLPGGLSSILEGTTFARQAGYAERMANLSRMESPKSGWDLINKAFGPPSMHPLSGFCSNFFRKQVQLAYPNLPLKRIMADPKSMSEFIGMKSLPGQTQRPQIQFDASTADELSGAESPGFKARLSSRRQSVKSGQSFLSRGSRGSRRSQRSSGSGRSSFAPSDQEGVSGEESAAPQGIKSLRAKVQLVDASPSASIVPSIAIKRDQSGGDAEGKATASSMMKSSTMPGQKPTGSRFLTPMSGIKSSMRLGGLPGLFSRTGLSDNRQMPMSSQMPMSTDDETGERKRRSQNQPTPTQTAPGSLALSKMKTSMPSLSVFSRESKEEQPTPIGSQSPAKSRRSAILAAMFDASTPEHSRPVGGDSPNVNFRGHTPTTQNSEVQSVKNDNISVIEAPLLSILVEELGEDNPVSALEGEWEGWSKLDKLLETLNLYDILEEDSYVTPTVFFRPPVLGWESAVEDTLKAEEDARKRQLEKKRKILRRVSFHNRDQNLSKERADVEDNRPEVSQPLSATEVLNSTTFGMKSSLRQASSSQPGDSPEINRMVSLHIPTDTDDGNTPLQRARSPNTSGVPSPETPAIGIARKKMPKTPKRASTESPQRNISGTIFGKNSRGLGGFMRVKEDPSGSSSLSPNRARKSLVQEMGSKLRRSFFGGDGSNAAEASLKIQVTTPSGGRPDASSSDQEEKVRSGKSGSENEASDADPRARRPQTPGHAIKRASGNMGNTPRMRSSHSLDPASSTGIDSDPQKRSSGYFKIPQAFGKLLKSPMGLMKSQPLSAQSRDLNPTRDRSGSDVEGEKTGKRKVSLPPSNRSSQNSSVSIGNVEEVEPAQKGDRRSRNTIISAVGEDGLKSGRASASIGFPGLVGRPSQSESEASLGDKDEVKSVAEIQRQRGLVPRVERAYMVSSVVGPYMSMSSDRVEYESLMDKEQRVNAKTMEKLRIVARNSSLRDVWNFSEIFSEKSGIMGRELENVVREITKGDLSETGENSEGDPVSKSSSLNSLRPGAPTTSALLTGIKHRISEENLAALMREISGQSAGSNKSKTSNKSREGEGVLSLTGLAKREESSATSDDRVGDLNDVADRVHDVPIEEEIELPGNFGFFMNPLQASCAELGLDSQLFSQSQLQTTMRTSRVLAGSHDLEDVVLSIGITPLPLTRSSRGQGTNSGVALLPSRAILATHLSEFSKSSYNTATKSHYIVPSTDERIIDLVRSHKEKETFFSQPSVEHVLSRSVHGDSLRKHALQGDQSKLKTDVLSVWQESRNKANQLARERAPLVSKHTSAYSTAPGTLLPPSRGSDHEGITPTRGTSGNVPISQRSSIGSAGVNIPRSESNAVSVAHTNASSHASTFNEISKNSLAFPVTPVSATERENPLSTLDSLLKTTAAGNRMALLTTAQVAHGPNLRKVSSSSSDNQDSSATSTDAENSQPLAGPATDFASFTNSDAIIQSDFLGRMLNNPLSLLVDLRIEKAISEAELHYSIQEEFNLTLMLSAEKSVRELSKKRIDRASKLNHLFYHLPFYISPFDLFCGGLSDGLNLPETYRGLGLRNDSQYAFSEAPSTVPGYIIPHGISGLTVNTYPSDYAMSHMGSKVSKHGSKINNPSDSTGLPPRVNSSGTVGTRNSMIGVVPPPNQLSAADQQRALVDAIQQLNALNSGSSINLGGFSNVLAQLNLGSSVDLSGFSGMLAQLNAGGSINLGALGTEALGLKSVNPKPWQQGTDHLNVSLGVGPVAGALTSGIPAGISLERSFKMRSIVSMSSTISSFLTPEMMAQLPSYMGMSSGEVTSSHAGTSTSALKSISPSLAMNWGLNSAQIMKKKGLVSQKMSSGRHPDSSHQGGFSSSGMSGHGSVSGASAFSSTTPGQKGGLSSAAPSTIIASATVKVDDATSTTGILATGGKKDSITNTSVSGNSTALTTWTPNSNMQSTSNLWNYAMIGIGESRHSLGSNSISVYDKSRVETLLYVWVEEGEAFSKGVSGQLTSTKQLEGKTRRLSSVLMGVESCAPGKKSPFLGVEHGTSGKSNYVSARGARKWRAYALNADTSTASAAGGNLASGSTDLVNKNNKSLSIPVDYGGMRLSLNKTQFETFKKICGEIVDPRLEDSFLWDSLHLIHRAPGTPLGAAPRRQDIERTLPKSRDLVSLRANRQRLFKELLCSDAVTARALVEEAYENRFVSEKIVKKQLKKRNQHVEDEGKIVIKRRNSY